MAVVRTHRYTVVTGKLAQLLEQRARLIQGLRSMNPAFTAATLIRQADGSYLDIWRWDSAEARRDTLEFPLVAATATLTTGHTVVDGEVLVER
ncbi:hypothetical protein ACFVMC_20985 [Nocardia sp. NPDC127579]|uniref:hypothetical protein n=1 Tax=Nocardia sp. NPDC127579 TaxID=3345402 RepID=UPI0036374D7E